MAISNKMGRPTRPLDWLLWVTVTAHNFSYVITNSIDGAVQLIDNQIRHRDDTELALEQLTLDMETLEE